MSRVRSIVFKLAAFFPFMLFSCLTAGLYGALHNQISYTVAPSYFHEFKFNQFAIDITRQNRIGAAWVGIQASWFMGAIIGLPVFLAALFVPKHAFIKTLWRTTLLVVGVTLLFSLGALAHAYLTLSPDALPSWTQNRALSKPLEFARAGRMHNASYLGGLVGIIAGLIYLSQVWYRHKQS